jgi:hypothetical protein
MSPGFVLRGETTMTLILFAFASGLLLIFAACVRHRRFQIVALRADESGVRNSPDTAERISRCLN